MARAMISGPVSTIAEGFSFFICLCAMLEFEPRASDLVHIMMYPELFLSPAQRFQSQSFFLWTPGLISLKF